MSDDSTISLLDQMGGICQERRDYQRAFFYYKSVLTHDSSDALGWSELASYHLDLKNFHEAITYADSALKRDSVYGPAFAKRGFAHLKLHEPKKALVDMQTALRLDSQYRKTYIYLACYFALNNDRSTAVSYLRMGIEKGFNDARWLEEEEALANIRTGKDYGNLVARLKK